MSKSGIPSITDMLSDGPHSRNLKENRKAIREGDDRGDDRMGGNCAVENGCYTPQECSFGLRVQ